MADDRALADLAAFARVEVESRDVEPWAELIAELHRSEVLDVEQAAWVIKLYNAYDDFGSAWSVFRRWPDPWAWAEARDSAGAADYPCTQERRNLRGGRVLHHLASYVQAMEADGARGQRAWLTRAVTGASSPALAYLRLYHRMRTVWGAGRQTAFEWAEFAAKVLGLAVEPPGAELWESEGPRRSLQRIYGNARPTPEWLDDRADECRAALAAAGVELSWWDFETIICDFNVMRDGRYYPGRHLAALREEIASAPREDRPALLGAWARFVPEPWAAIEPGIDPALMPVYRDTGRMVLPEVAR